MKENQTTYESMDQFETEWIQSFENDLNSTDKFGTTTYTRLDMYNPLYYINDYFDGYNTSVVADNWRINTTTASDESFIQTLTFTVALENYGAAIEDTLLWDSKDQRMELELDGITAFINWVETNTK